MIYDKIANMARYSIVGSELEAMKLLDQDLADRSFSEGRFDIIGDELYGIGLSYDTKPAAECLWEAHRRYIDIHVVLGGQELVSISDINRMKSSKGYDKFGDYELFTGHEEQSVCLGPGDFLVLYPDEVHRTGCSSLKPEEIQKIVYKILLKSDKHF